MVKQHWKTFVLTLQRRNINITLLASLLAVYSVRYHFLLFILLLYGIYYRKHLNTFVCIVIMILIGFGFINTMRTPTEVNGIVRIGDIESFEYNDRITIHYEGRKYHFNTQRDTYKLGDKLQMKAYIRPFLEPTRPFAFDQKMYYLGNNIHGQLDIQSVELINSSFHIQSFRLQLLNQVRTLKSSEFMSALWFADNNELDKEVLATWNILFLFKVTGIHLFVLLFMIKKLFVENSLAYNIIHISVLIIFWYLQAWHVTMFRYIVLWLLYQLFKTINIRVHPITLLLISMTIHLMIQPYLVYNYGFLLGYSIVFFIRMIRSWMPFKHTWWSYYVLSIHISTWIGILSGTIYVFSIILMPFFSLFVTYVLFLGSIIVVIIPLFDVILFAWYEQFMLLLRTFENFQVAFFIPSSGGIYNVIFVSIIFWIFVSRSYQTLIKKLYILILFIGVSYISISYDTTSHIYFLDVGQGDAMIIKSNRCVAVVDAFDGVVETLQGFGIQQIDYFFLTHNDLDHTKEKDDIFKAFHVKNAYTSTFQNIDKFQSMYVDRVISCGDFNIQALSPNIDYQNDNDNSLVLKLSIQSFDMLLMGDAGVETEFELMKKYGDNLKADVLKIGHHGSSTSTSKQFLDIVNPDYTVISVGRNNRYGMPHASVINTLLRVPVIVYRTDMMGTIHFEFEQGEFVIHTYLA